MKHLYICAQVMGVLAATLITGCVASQVRKGADLLAAFTHQVSEEGASFVQSRTALAQARRANIAMLEVNAIELETSVDRDVEIWRLAGSTGKRRVELFQGIRAYANSAAAKNGELAALRKQHEASIASAKSAVVLRQTDLSKVSKALATLSQEPDLQADLKFFGTYFKEVSAGIKKAKEEADQRVKDTETAAKKAVP